MEQTPQSTPVKNATMTDSELNIYKGLTFWMKFFGVLSYLLCGFIGLMSLLITVATLGLGLLFVVPFYVPFAVVYFFYGKWLFRSSRAFGRLENTSDYRADIVDGLGAIRNMAKTAGIITIVYIILSVLSIVAFMIIAVFLGTALPEDFFEIDIEDDGTTTSIERGIEFDDNDLLEQ